MKKYQLWVICVSWLMTVGFTSGSNQIYLKAVKFAKNGNIDFSFMQYNQLLREFPRSQYRQKALFAKGEYYFRMSNLRAAKEAFQAVLEEYKGSDEEIYVLACLLSIAQHEKDLPAVEKLEKQIIHLQQVSLVFRESKKITFISPLYQRHEAVIHIDKIEFFVEGKLFAKVSY